VTGMSSIPRKSFSVAAPPPRRAWTFASVRR
jgi:hypothetical protein